LNILVVVEPTGRGYTERAGEVFLFLPSPYDDPEYWRKGAQAMRDLAAQIADQELKKQALQVADEFDRHASKARERSKRLPAGTTEAGFSG
jgi:hypothetical protein